MEYKEEKTKQIDVVAIAKTMWQHKKAYIIALPVVAVVSYLLIVCVPRTYTSTVKLAPELSSFNSSSLSDIASSFGFDMGTSKGGGDALFPDGGDPLEDDRAGHLLRCAVRQPAGLLHPL